MSKKGKKYKGKICAYCAENPATTEDHVFAREFFLVADRHGLPKAPACKTCNNEKSKLEHYLTTVLSFGGRHAQASENLQSTLPGRLAKNQKLNKILLDGMKPAWIRDSGGLYQQTASVDFESTKLEALLKYIGKGLAWHHWAVYLRPEDDVSVMLVSDMGSALLQSIIGELRPAQRVVEDLGNGTVKYVGLQSPNPPQLTVWTISMYGGLVLTDDRRKSDGNIEPCSMWWIITGPQQLAEMVSRMKARH